MYYGIIVCDPARLNHPKCAAYTSTLEYGTVARMDSRADAGSQYVLAVATTYVQHSEEVPLLTYQPTRSECMF